MKTLVDPADYGLSEAAAQMLKQVYVNEHRSMVDAVTITKVRTGEKVTQEAGLQFIRDNGWKRPPSTKGSVWRKYENAHHRQVMARRKKLEK